MIQSQSLFTCANLAATKPSSNTNKYWVVQPGVEFVRNKCSTLEQGEFIITEKQMIPFYATCPAWQYVKNKPNLFGIKLFIWCGKSGRPYIFLLYQWTETGISSQYSYMALGSSIEPRLIKNIPWHENFKKFFDNFFTSTAFGIWEIRESGKRFHG